MGTAAITIHSNEAASRRWLSQMSACWHRLTSKSRLGRGLQIEQNAMLGNKASISLVSVDGERVLVGVTGGCIRFHSVRSGATLELPVGGRVR